METFLLLSFTRRYCVESHVWTESQVARIFLLVLDLTYNGLHLQ